MRIINTPLVPEPFQVRNLVIVNDDGEYYCNGMWRAMDGHLMCRPTHFLKIEALKIVKELS